MVRSAWDSGRVMFSLLAEMRNIAGGSGLRRKIQSSSRDILNLKHLLDIPGEISSRH